MGKSLKPQANPRLSFGEAVKSVLNQYACFKGRARRSEYWWFSLFMSFVYVVAMGVDKSSGITFFDNDLYGPCCLVVVLAFFVPSLAVTFRRLHDTGRSGWNWLWSFIPLIGGILLLVWTLSDSEVAPNLYGESPKYGDNGRIGRG